MNILIVDDERLARSVCIKYLEQSTLDYLTFEASNTLEAEAILDSQDIDVIILDIEMPGESGIDFLIRSNPGVKVIFATAYNEHAIQAFELNAIDYLLKPFDQERFLTALDKASKYDLETFNAMFKTLKSLSDNKSTISRILVKDRDKIHFITCKDIIAIVANGDYCNIKTMKNKYMHLISLNKLEKSLDPQTFVRIHRSTIINIEKVKEISILTSQKMFAKMIDDSEYDISRSGQMKIKDLT